MELSNGIELLKEVPIKQMVTDLKKRMIKDCKRMKVPDQIENLKGKSVMLSQESARTYA